MKATFKIIFLLVIMVLFSQDKTLEATTIHTNIDKSNKHNIQKEKKQNLDSVTFKFQSTPLHNSFPLMREMNELETKKFENLPFFFSSFFFIQENNHKNNLIHLKINTKKSLHFLGCIYLHLQCFRL